LSRHQCVEYFLRDNHPYFFFANDQGSAFSLPGDNEKQHEYRLPTRQVYTHTNPYIQTSSEANQKRNELAVLHPPNDTAHQLNNWQRITTNASQDRVATKNPQAPPFMFKLLCLLIRQHHYDHHLPHCPLQQQRTLHL
jgi:hypothetical protein